MKPKHRSISQRTNRICQWLTDCKACRFSVYLAFFSFALRGRPAPFFRTMSGKKSLASRDPLFLRSSYSKWALGAGPTPPGRSSASSGTGWLRRFMKSWYSSLDKSTRGSYCFDVLLVRRDARKQHLETGEASSGIRLLEWAGISKESSPGPRRSTEYSVDSQLHWSDWAKLPRAGVASESSDIEPSRMQASVRGSVGGGPVVGLRAKEERAFQPETRHAKHREGIR